MDHALKYLVQYFFSLPDMTSILVDLFGRGYTDAPADPTISYDTNMYITQLALLFQHVGFEKADIVGYSMVCLKDSFWAAEQFVY